MDKWTEQQERLLRAAEAVMIDRADGGSDMVDTAKLDALEAVVQELIHAAQEEGDRFGGNDAARSAFLHGAGAGELANLAPGPVRRAVSASCSPCGTGR